MGIGNIFKAFQPKDTVFFTLFEKVAINLVEMFLKENSRF